MKDIREVERPGKIGLTISPTFLCMMCRWAENWLAVLLSPAQLTFWPTPGSFQGEREECNQCEGNWKLLVHYRILSILGSIIQSLEIVEFEYEIISGKQRNIFFLIRQKTQWRTIFHSGKPSFVKIWIKLSFLRLLKLLSYVLLMTYY